MIKSLELKIPPLLVFVVFGTLTWIIPAPFRIETEIVNFGLSTLFFLAGSLIAILGVWEFKKNKTTVNPMTPQESQSLVSNGIYRLTRNPMYLGFSFWLISWGLFLGNPLAVVSIVSFISYMQYFQIIPEERILSKLFGSSYSQYMATTRRWL